MTDAYMPQMRPSVTPVFRQGANPFHSFTAARQAMIRAWVEWLHTLPPSADIRAELDGTIGQMTGIAALTAPGAEG